MLFLKHYQPHFAFAGQPDVDEKMQFHKLNPNQPRFLQAVKVQFFSIWKQVNKCAIKHSVTSSNQELLAHQKTFYFKVKRNCQRWCAPPCCPTVASTPVKNSCIRAFVHFQGALMPPSISKLEMLVFLEIPRADWATKQMATRLSGDVGKLQLRMKFTFQCVARMCESGIQDRGVWTRMIILFRLGT